jgi:hypothetical protein
MRFAFKRGIKLLTEPGSDSVQSQKNPVDGESSSIPASGHTEGIVKVPKNVTQLKPAINKLMCKVIMIAV